MVVNKKEPGTEEESRKEAFSEDSSTSSNDRIREDDILAELRGANKGLSGSIRKSKDTTKALKKQGKKLKSSLKKKKKIRGTVGKDEKLTTLIEEESSIFMIKNKIINGIKNLFSFKKAKDSAVTKAAQKEEGKAEEYSENISEDEADQTSSIEKKLEETDSDASVDDELEKTLAGLQSLRRHFKSQTQRIKSQTHAAKEMQTLDKNTIERSDTLTKRVKKIE